MSRGRWVGLLLLIASAGPLVAQGRPTLQVTLPTAASLGSEAPSVRVRNALREKSVADLLRNGFPARLHFRIEQWSADGLFHSKLRSADWDVLIRFDALGRQYEMVRVQRDSAVSRTRYTQLADVVNELERPVRAPIAPVSEGRSLYYRATVELEMLSVSDLDEVEGWLRGELKPAVRGQRNPGTALGRGARTLLTRLLGGEKRILETSTESFTVSSGR